MPSPLGHALGGAIIGAALAPRGSWLVTRPLATLGAALRTPIVAIAAVTACLPDADFAWGRHSMETHSLGAALAAGVAVWIIGRGRAPRLATAVALAWASHVLFDWLGSDDTAPIGVMALWPWSSSFYFADAFLFEAISRRYWLPGFWRHNLWALVSEAGLLAPVLVALVLGRRRYDRRQGRDRVQGRGDLLGDGVPRAPK